MPVPFSHPTTPVIPAKAGSALQQRGALVIHFSLLLGEGKIKMDLGFRRDDGRNLDFLPLVDAGPSLRAK